MASVKLSDLPSRDRKIIRAWCMYDWANSAFATSGIVAFFPFTLFFFLKMPSETRLLCGDSLSQEVQSGV